MAGTKEGRLKFVAKSMGISLEEYLSRNAAGLKWCYKCQQWKPIGSFSTDNTRADGKCPCCQDCTRVKERKSTKGFTPWMKGKKHTAESSQKMSKSRIGNKNRLGKPFTPEQRQRISQTLRVTAVRGPANHKWKDGLSHLRKRRGRQNTAWRLAVFERDGYTCQECGDKKGGNLVAHHIKKYSDYPELRYDVNNGVTLCETCHINLHKQKGF